MDHPLKIKELDLIELEDQLAKRIRELDFRRYGSEPNYNPALVTKLDGFSFSGSNFSVSLSGSTMTNDKHGSEPPSGADLAISADIHQGKESKRKAVLVQCKRRSLLRNSKERERLIGQIEKMERITKHPKVLVIEEYQGAIPSIQSGSTILKGSHPREFALSSWLARRFIRTFDGDTRKHVYEAAQSADLDRIWVKAEFESRDEQPFALKT
ncbi:MAG: hypothetical protein JNK37_14800 [Verrucomicrobiales bacterium]|nr:hypothetical protein [Verrucomicrobiales bacterium]